MALFAGTISGTSIDGVDVALLDIVANEKPQLLAAETFAYPEPLRSKLERTIIEPQCSFQQLGELDMAIGAFHADAINQLLNQTDIQRESVTAIGSHGQTIYHAPDALHPFSLQIGNPNLIAEKTGITTIADMRQRDMICGGQGAPMVPVFHQAMFGDKEIDRAIVNIGGIANITILPSAPQHPITGFDTGPGNTLLDSWIQRHHQKKYDAGGQWASQGQVNTALLDQLMTDSYFKRPIPKSTGREHFHLNWLQQHLDKLGTSLSPVDVQATLLVLTCNTIVQAITQHAEQAKEVIICGGGAHNAAMMSCLAALMPNRHVSDTTAFGINPDYVEAAAFAYLASLTTARLPGNIPTVTGASRPTILGGVYFSNQKQD
ncbi:Anhydro-N-acetylmuramic acid kinase [Methylophaga frappieri]|uniref:Anhydro-N-acetylmuramic acid kinase n=1 Tax=Methylophaga frappieri (strain ATCC BAA-2434 / DSM 25690 / JAM7) TaxID=754477 RepID=I1YGW9_METFJ|nr:anhydro-N-acetylmuramic acid kinase [Methylophaga frappieri]AFJ02162.1 Anhydro-N-acetylmuramic acid kinase [Methylophaga frappieri]